MKCLRLLVTAALLLAVSAATATAGTDLRQPLFHFVGDPLLSPSAHAGPEMRSLTPSAELISADLKHAVGLSAAQVSPEHVCAATGAGHAACDALVLTAAATGDLLHPDVNAETPTGQTAPSANTPQFLQQAYDLQYLSATNGGSDTIGIIDAGGDPTAAADMATFRTKFGLPACTVASGCFEQVSQTGSTSSLPAAISGWGTEESLDLDAVSSLCPNCHIILVDSSSTSFADLKAAAATAANLGANQISESFGDPVSGSYSESGWIYPGVQVFAATGDDGYAGPHENQLPAAFPDVNAVGGTTLTALAASGSDTYSDRGFAESAWSLSGDEGTGSGCDTDETKPSYQTDTGCTGRAYGDVSADANPDTGLDVYSSSDGGWELVGGTSLATPLVAAYAAVTGIGSTSSSAAWAYANSSLLNDPTSGSNGNCATNIAYICTAGVGYDGPTGTGSIEGDLSTGAPGVGAAWNGSDSTSPSDAVSTSAGSVTLEAGVYPNGLATTYFWQYGSSISYGESTPTETLTASSLPQAVQDTIALSAGSTYHFRLVAENADGTTYGDDQTISTPAGTPPVNSVAPSISGTAAEGQTLSADPGTWSPAGTVSYQWQNDTAAGGWRNIAGATTPSYVVAASDVGDPIHVIVTETAADASASSAQSAPTAMVSASPPVNTTPPSISGSATEGDTLTVDPGTWSPTGTVSEVWERGGPSGWSVIADATTQSYTLTSDDVGASIEVVVTETNGAGNASATATAGPVIASTSQAPPAATTTTPDSTNTTPTGGQTTPAQSQTPPTLTTPSQSTSDTPTQTQTTPPTTTSGQTSATSSSDTGPPKTPAAPEILVAPRLSTPARLQPGATVTLSTGVSTGGTASERLYACDVICRPAAAVGITSMKITATQAGDYFSAVLTVSGEGSSATAWSMNSLGPVRGATVAVAAVPAGSSVLRDGAGQKLATITRRRASSRVSVTLTPARNAPASTVRLCAVSRGAPPACTRTVQLSGTARRLTLATPSRSTVQIVAVAHPRRRAAR